MAAQPARPLQLYDVALSGHSHRARLFLSLLRLPHEIVPVDLAKGGNKTPAFLKMNPFGQVPVLNDDGVIVADSTAILVYLATRYDNDTWLPRDALGAAEVQRWLSAASGPVKHGPCDARLITLFGAPLDHQRASQISAALFKVMESHLQERDFLVGDRASIADIACYSYVAHAPEGGISLQPFPAIRAWLARIEALPGFVPMPCSPQPLVSAAD
jgi:glutathione S-transferase